MSRLTNHTTVNGDPAIEALGKRVQYFERLYPILKRLAHYEDLEEQGRLKEFPCKVGDTIWAIFPTWTPIECEVVAIEILTSITNIDAKVVDTDADRSFWPSDFGRTVFLTKGEAEAKLAELKGE